MKKIIWIANILISLIISFIIYFNEIKISSLLIKSLITAIFIFAILSLLTNLILNIKKNKKLIFVVIIIVIFLVLISIYSYTFPKLSCNNYVKPHFRTNIITNNCDFGRLQSCSSKDPWYYKEGCNLEKDKLIEVLEKSNFKEEHLETCNEICEFDFKNHESLFCSEYFRCDILIDCNITCENY